MTNPTLLLLTAAALSTLAGCEPGPALGADRPASEPAHVHPGTHDDMASMPTDVAASGGSVYQLPGEWRNQHDALLPLSSLAGRPQVVAFVYTHCTFACPRIVARMKEVEARATAAGANVGLVLVSIDPERDTPERLANYAEGTRLDPERWTLLNGSDEQILELSVLLGIQYRATGDGDFAHTNALILLDEHGTPTFRLDGLEAEVGPILDRLEAGT